MNKNNGVDNTHFSLDFSYNEMSDENVKKLIDMIFSDEEIITYEILIALKADIFQKKYKSVAEFYRVLSNSNQSFGIGTAKQSNTNRNWWKSHFMGGHYKTYNCNDILYIYFNLETVPNTKKPNEIQLRNRIAKALKYKPVILSGYRNLEIKNILEKIENCYSSTQYIGKHYFGSN